VKETSIKVAPVADPTKLVRSSEPVIDPIIMAIYGDQGRGKSRFLATGPDQIGIAPFEAKTKQTVTKYAHEWGKTCVWPSISLIRAENSFKLDALDPYCMKRNDGDVHTPSMQARAREIGLMDPAPKCCQIHYHRYHVNRSKAAVFALASDPLVKIVCIDTFGQLCDDMLYANYGRLDNIIPLERKSFNQEVKDFLNAINHKHVILTHHSSNVWKDNKPTSKTQPQGFRKLGHYANIVLEFLRKDAEDEDGGQVSNYSIRVKDCQANPSLIGQTILTDEDITFQNVAMQVYPESDYSVWE
jgi:hypothetical protein